MGSRLRSGGAPCGSAWAPAGEAISRSSSSGLEFLREIARGRDHGEKAERLIAAIAELVHFERPDVDDVVLLHFANGLTGERVARAPTIT